MAKRKSVASAHGENDQAKHTSSKRQAFTAVTMTEAPPAVPIKTEKPTVVTKDKSVSSKQNIDKSVSHSRKTVLEANTITSTRSTIYDDIVIIKVGPAATKFSIHRGVLTTSSSFFRDILQSGTVDAPPNVTIALEGDFTVILLPAEDPTVFSRVNWWFYNKDFRNPDEKWEDIDWQHLCDVYIFAVDKGIARLHNTCTDSAIRKVKSGGLFPGQETTNALWNSGGNVTQFKKLFVELFSTQWDLESAIRANPSYHQTFLNQLVIELHKMRSEGCRPTIGALWKMRAEYWIYGSDNPITVD